MWIPAPQMNSQMWLNYASEHIAQDNRRKSFHSLDFYYRIQYMPPVTFARGFFGIKFDAQTSGIPGRVSGSWK
jgi:hypothetical protein